MKAFSKSLTYPYPKLAICLDMVADIDAEFKMEYFSLIQAENDLKEIWALANELGYKEFIIKPSLSSFLIAFTRSVSSQLNNL